MTDVFKIHQRGCRVRGFDAPEHLPQGHTRADSAAEDRQQHRKRLDAVPLDRWDNHVAPCDRHGGDRAGHPRSWRDRKQTTGVIICGTPRQTASVGRGYHLGRHGRPALLDHRTATHSTRRDRRAARGISQWNGREYRYGNPAGLGRHPARNGRVVPRQRRPGREKRQPTTTVGSRDG